MNTAQCTCNPSIGAINQVWHRHVIGQTNFGWTTNRPFSISLILLMQHATTIPTQ